MLITAALYFCIILLENSNFTAEAAPVSPAVFLCYPGQLYRDSLVHGTRCANMSHLLHCPEVLPLFHKVIIYITFCWTFWVITKNLYFCYEFIQIINKT